MSILPKRSSYTLTDKELSELSSADILFSINRLKKKKNQYVIYKYFLDSILSVKEESSQIMLLALFNKDTGDLSNIPISKVDEIYQILFHILPSQKAFQSKTENIKLLFEFMSKFILNLYSLYPYFFDIDIDGSLFSFQTSFIINFLSNMPFKTIISKGTEQFFSSLQSNGSLTNILNYLFEQLFKGIEYEKISEVIFDIMKSIDSDFLFKYLTKKNMISNCSPIYINEQKKSIFLMCFKIPFYIKYLDEKFNIVSNLLYGENKNNKRDMSKEQIIQIFSSLQMSNFFEQFLFQCTERIISEGRLINTENPFKSNQKEIQIDSYQYYPEKINDTLLLEVLTLICNVIFIFTQYDVHEMAIEFYPIITSFMKIVPYIARKNDIDSIIEFFRYVKKIDTSLFHHFKNVFYEATRNRIIGNYKITYDNYLIDILNDNEIILTFFRIISLLSNDHTEFFELCHFETAENVNKLLSIIASRSLDQDYQNFIKNCLEYYQNYSTNPETFSNYMKIITKYLKRNSQNMNNIKNIFDYIIENIFDYIIENSKILTNIDDKLLSDFYQICLYKVDQIGYIIPAKLSKLETIDENMIKLVNATSSCFVSIKFSEDHVIKHFKSCLSYLNDLNHNQFDFNDLNDQAKFNLICILTNSCGFLMHDEYLKLFSLCMKKYGMCIEVLNVISKIIGCLKNFIESQNSNEILSETNEQIFKIVQILIDNSIEYESTTSDSNDDNHNYLFRSRNYYESSKEIEFHFSLLSNKKPDSSGKINNYFYSYIYKGKPIDDKFGYLLNEKVLQSSYSSNSIANEFINNITDYATKMIKKFGKNFDYFDLCEKIIDFKDKLNEKKKAKNKKYL